MMSVAGVMGSMFPPDPPNSYVDVPVLSVTVFEGGDVGR